jgi:hypothetical protein
VNMALLDFTLSGEMEQAFAFGELWQHGISCASSFSSSACFFHNFSDTQRR